ncbi:MAG: hypothetical protein FWC28_03785 [Proteobacteria bacterium]|nr:hypothetical protein [Cystobacterineae bacterium]MCL2259083.1 hypothetical protein [Cystobacterineae bacterium]MCL2314358.1 hypothetical protein [Pseudomonadota bacterium]
MSQLPESASFHERVQALFCFLRGHGAALSPLDAELLELWASTQVPFEVVARGMRHCFESRLSGLKKDQTLSLPSLRTCRRHVESEIARYSRIHMQPATPTPENTETYAQIRHQRLKKQLKGFAKKYPWAQKTTAKFLEHLGKPADIHQAMYQEILAIFVLAQALPPEEKKKLLEETRQLAKTREALSLEAAKEQWRFFLAYAFKQRFEIRNWG